MNRRTFLETTSAAALTAVVSTGAVAATAEGSDVLDDCACEGTYEACCGPDGPCDC